MRYTAITIEFIVPESLAKVTGEHVKSLMALFKNKEILPYATNINISIRTDTID